MKLSTLLMFNAIVALLFGIGFVLMPGSVLSLYGVSPGGPINLVAQFVGVELIGVGLLCWFARYVQDSYAERAIILAFLVANAIGVIVAILGVLAGTYNALGWLVVAIYLILALGYAYFQFMKPGTA